MFLASGHSGNRVQVYVLPKESVYVCLFWDGVWGGVGYRMVVVGERVTGIAKGVLMEYF